MAVIMTTYKAQLDLAAIPSCPSFCYPSGYDSGGLKAGGFVPTVTNTRIAILHQ